MGYTPPSVRSRVDLPTYRDISHILPRLRELHPDLDCYVDGENGFTLLLQYQPGKERIARGRHLLSQGNPSVDAKLMAQGFALLDDLSLGAIESGYLMLRAQQIMYATPRMVWEAWKEKLANSDGSAAEQRAEARMRDRVRSDYRSDHRILFRHRVSIVRPNVNYGPSPVSTS